MRRVATLGLLAFALCCWCATPAVEGAEQDKYTSKYDNINVDNILSNQRLLNPYINCLLHNKSCTPEALELKKFLPDALATNCEKCTDKQKENAEKVIKFLSKNRPEVWEQLIAKYDPENIFRTKYAEQAKKLGVDVPAPK